MGSKQVRGHQQWKSWLVFCQFGRKRLNFLELGSPIQTLINEINFASVNAKG